MRDPDEFDSFYQAARSRLLLQTYALTGDLPASRRAVRDAFVAAWHHWPKVSRLEDPEGWVRPHAWQHAQRRHTARIWHRDRTLDEDSRATLDALGKLTVIQRKALLLTLLGSSTLEQMAREVALTDEDASSVLQSATSQFAVLREVPASSLRTHLEALAPRVADARFPRSSIIRRAGAARRRTHTGAGVVMAVVALVLSGTAVHQTGGSTADLGGVGAQVREQPEDPATVLAAADLLPREDVDRLVPGGARPRVSTSGNTEGDGINVVCQQDRYADPDGLAGLVRTFDLPGRPETGAVQSLELSSSPREARAAYRQVLAWFGECQEPRVQLLSSHELTGVGDEGMLLVLRKWAEPVTTYTLGIARSGGLVTSTVREVRDAGPAALPPMVRLTAASVERLCDHPAAGSCVGRRPGSRPAPVPAAEEAPGLLQVVDVPPVEGITRPWLATDPVRPRVNTAATGCDKADFRGKAVSRAATRSFLAPEAKVDATFGITETAGRFRSPGAARDFVATLRERMDGCEDRDLASTVEERFDVADGATETVIYRVTTEVSDERAVSFDMALVRRGDLVAQIGFVPAPGRTLGEDAFRALAARALERLGHLPGSR